MNSSNKFDTSCCAADIKGIDGKKMANQKLKNTFFTERGRRTIYFQSVWDQNRLFPMLIDE